MEGKMKGERPDPGTTRHHSNNLVQGEAVGGRGFLTRLTADCWHSPAHCRLVLLFTLVSTSSFPPLLSSLPSSCVSLSSNHTYASLIPLPRFWPHTSSLLLSSETSPAPRTLIPAFLLHIQTSAPFLLALASPFPQHADYLAPSLWIKK